MPLEWESNTKARLELNGGSLSLKWNETLNALCVCIVYRLQLSWAMHACKSPKYGNYTCTVCVCVSVCVCACVCVCVYVCVCVCAPPHVLIW